MGACLRVTSDSLRGPSPIEGQQASMGRQGVLHPQGSGHPALVHPPESVHLILDVGTHKVLGLAVRSAGDGIEVLASSRAVHASRSMRDGQIHDVPAVARVLRRVVDELEQRTGLKLARAHIAAAGRALKTAKGSAKSSHEAPVLFTREMQQLLEWEAVAAAQSRLLESLSAEDRARGYYCIAHTAIGAQLDGDPIASLVGQRGLEFSLEVLATFLPVAVVDSLEAALHQAGLEVAGLTLEPVAALEAVIPPTMRHLNLVLVDIGAGTSDIVFTGQGQVKAFAMVPEAGDAITEAVSKHFLLDFAVAERVKREAGGGATLEVENVLGEPVSITPELLREATEQATEHLALRIASAVMDWSTDPPEALLLVGGGSQTPGLADFLAQYLELTGNRVAVRDRRAVRGVTGEERLQGPEVVTAFGIGLLAARGIQRPPIRVRVNGRPVSLFLPERCTVREAVRIAGLPTSELVGRMGPGFSITVNGSLMLIPGEKGQAAQVWVNGRPADFDTVLQNQDDVRLEPPLPGRPPRVTVSDVVQRWLAQACPAGPDGRPRAPRACVDGEWREFPVLVRRNGQAVGFDERVMDLDELEIRFPRTGRELLEALGLPVQGNVRCYVNGEPAVLAAKGRLYRNGVPVEPDEPCGDGDSWDLTPGEPLNVGDMLDQLGLPKERTLRVRLNGAPIAISLPAEVRREGELVPLEERVVEGARYTVHVEREVPLYRIIPYAGLGGDAFPLERLRDGRRLELRVGGRPAGFTTPVTDGDDVVVTYEL